MKDQLPDVLRMVIENRLSTLHTALPGRIESYDSTTKKASVKPLIKKRFENNETLPLPVIENAPVVFPGTTDFLLHYPLKQGDGCLILFSERSMESWLSLGGDVEPVDPRKFALADAICVPGLFPFNEPGKIASEDTAFEILFKDFTIKVAEDGAILFDNGSGTIELKADGQVDINSGNLTVDV